MEGRSRAQKGNWPPTLDSPVLPALLSLGARARLGLLPPLGSVRRSTPTGRAGPLPCLSPQRHHFAQAIAILNTHGCNIFDHFSRKVMGLGVGGQGVGAGSWPDVGEVDPRGGGS